MRTAGEPRPTGNVWRTVLEGLLPRSLASQMALVMALALLAAQLANFALILEDRQLRQLTRQRDEARSIYLAIVGDLLAVAETERRALAQSRSGPRVRLDWMSSSVIERNRLPRDTALERQIRDDLSRSGFAVDAVQVASENFRVGGEAQSIEPPSYFPPRPRPPPSPFPPPPPPPPPRFGPPEHGATPSRAPPPPPFVARPPPAEERGRGAGGSPVAEGRDRETLISIRLVGEREWLNAQVFTPPEDWSLSLRLIVATLLLYSVVLGAVVILARRIARPLADMAAAARGTGAVGSMSGHGPRLIIRGPSDLKATAQAFNDMQARVEALLRDKDAMLGAIGHDLRTPLTALRIRAENLPDSMERQRMIATIDHLSRTVDGILTLSQLGADRELPSLTDLTALLETLVDEFTDLGSHVALKDCKRVTAVVRPHQIMRAIRNLIENAIKFGSYARLSLIELEDELEIRVDDDGPGLPLSSVQALMAPFTRLEGSRNRMTGGAGLGLSIVHTIIEIHGGWLRFENRGSGGLRVRVGLRRQLIDKDAPRKRHLNPN